MSKELDRKLQQLRGWDPGDPSFPSPKRSREPLVIHADAADADWIKRGKWDIPADNIQDLREWLFEQQMTVEAFKAARRLPVERGTDAMADGAVKLDVAGLWLQRDERAARLRAASGSLRISGVNCGSYGSRLAPRTTRSYSRRISGSASTSQT